MIDDDVDQRWAEAMRAAQDGDRAVYAGLLREVAVAAERYCRRRLPTREDADDTVQEILITIHKARATYDPERPFRPWLVTITRRRIADRLKMLKRRGSHVELDEASDVTFDAGSGNDAEGMLSAGELRAAIAALPPGQRQALEMMKLKEMSLAEASAASGVSVSALKVATHRAIAALRRTMGSRGGDS